MTLLSCVYKSVSGIFWPLKPNGIDFYDEPISPFSKRNNDDFTPSKPLSKCDALSSTLYSNSDEALQQFQYTQDIRDCSIDTECTLEDSTVTDSTDSAWSAISDAMSTSCPTFPSQLQLTIEEGGANANDTTVVSEGQYLGYVETYNPENERKKRLVQVDELLASGWPQNATELFYKLSIRGFEPLLPKSWQMDFRSLPDSLFTESNDEAFIKPICSSEFRAIKALESLIFVGPRVRDTLIVKALHRGPEVILRQAIQDYVKWAQNDLKSQLAYVQPNLLRHNNSDNMSTNTDDFLLPPLITWVSGKREVSSRTLQQQILQKLKRLHQDWIKATQKIDQLSLPTALYGVVLSHTVMAIVAFPMDQNDQDEEFTMALDHNTSNMLREFPLPFNSLLSVAFFNFNDLDYDVWNALAIAILVVHARNTLFQLCATVPCQPNFSRVA